MVFFGKNSNRDPLFSNMWVFLRGNFVALEANTLQSSAKGCQVLIQAHLVILLGCPNSYGGCTEQGAAHSFYLCWASLVVLTTSVAGSPGRALHLRSPSGMRETSYVWDLDKAQGKFK